MESSPSHFFLCHKPHHRLNHLPFIVNRKSHHYARFQTVRSIVPTPALLSLATLSLIITPSGSSFVTSHPGPPGSLTCATLSRGIAWNCNPKGSVRELPSAHRRLKHRDHFHPALITATKLPLRLLAGKHLVVLHYPAQNLPTSTQTGAARHLTQGFLRTFLPPSQRWHSSLHLFSTTISLLCVQ